MKKFKINTVFTKLENFHNISYDYCKNLNFKLN